MLNRNSGFTLIELVMVIVILGILAVVAVPRFLDLRTDAEIAARDGVVGGVRAAIATAHAARIIDGDNTVAQYPDITTWPSNYPDVLDGVTGGPGVTGNLFEYVLQGPVTDTRWTKESATTYQYIDASNVYTYTNTNGMFVE